MIDTKDFREKAEFYHAHEKVALARRLELACDEIERLRAALHEIANRAGNYADVDAAEWMPSIYTIACEAVGEKPRVNEQTSVKDGT